MSSVSLSWRSVEPSHSQRFLVKGTVLAVAYVPGTLSRFLIEEVRTREADGFAGTTYRLRDAEKVSDADVRRGVYSPVVFQGDLDACLSEADR